MKVYIIEAYSYDPEDIVGVFATREAAVKAMLSNPEWQGQSCTREACNGIRSNEHWHDRDNWRIAEIREYDVAT